MDISFEVLLKRAEIRDVPKYGIEFLERYKNKYIPIQQKYLEAYKPKQKSDIVIDNTDFYLPKIIKI
ncbi:MAG: HAD-superfamily hydrolase, subfamily variant 1 [Clostridia bacterium]|nr:HAD-superfamily hydrolase, subfamily variant 1 [Clostridia bacterium]